MGTACITASAEASLFTLTAGASSSRVGALSVAEPGMPLTAMGSAGTISTDSVDSEDRKPLRWGSWRAVSLWCLNPWW